MINVIYTLAPMLFRHENMACGHENMARGHENMTCGHENMTCEHENMMRGHENMTCGHENMTRGHENIRLRYGYFLPEIEMILYPGDKKGNLLLNLLRDASAFSLSFIIIAAKLE
jgi:hypothetical protein